MVDLQQEGTSNNEQEVTFKETHGISAGFKNNGEVNSNHRVSSGKTLSTLGSIVIPLGLSSIATSSMISMQTNKESKGKEQRLHNEDVIDLTTDSPIQNVTQTKPFNGFLKRGQQLKQTPSGSNHRTQCQMLDDETSSQLIIHTPTKRTSAEQIFTRYMPGGMNTEEDSSMGLSVPVHEPWEKLKNPQGEQTTNLLGNAECSIKSTGVSFSERDDEHIRLAYCSKEGEQSKTTKSSKSEKVFSMRHQRSLPADPAKCRQKFKPPRMHHGQNVSGSTSGIMRSPIAADYLHPPTNGPTRTDSESIDMQNQIKEDEMLAMFLQEEYSRSMDDAQLAKMLQEEENARMRRRAQSSAHPSISAVQVTQRELPRFLPLARSLSPMRTETSSRMRILRNIHNRHVVRGGRGRGRGRDRDRGHVREQEQAENTADNLYHSPEGVGLNASLEFLTAMEVVSQGGFPSLAHVDRDFNENDYEMLLALDDTNGLHHSGASRNQIERLPISVIQPTDVCEACSICLEIPAVGDIVRRLPCMHCFHQQCIDTWLARQAKCPVCKVSL